VRIFCHRRQTDMSMGKKTIIPLAWMMGLFVSPEALELQGHLAGISGLGFVLPLAAAIILHWLNAIGTTSNGSPGTTPSGEIQLLTDSWGPFTASLLLLMARPVVAVCLATAVLVTSGFVFNEVFFYWFPNFGFAALVLVILLIVNLAGPQAAATAQVVFTTTAIIGLAGLSIVGLFTWPSSPAASQVTLTGLNSQSIGLALIAFVGYDLLQYTDHRLDQTRLTTVIKTGLIAGGFLFTLWNMTSLLFVAPSRLMDTSIPHILAAKAILGHTGRIVIGVVAIAGACSAVNYLYQSVARMMVRMAHHHLLPPLCARPASRPVLAFWSLAATTGLLMAMGFAGSDLLDVSMRAGLLLWLVFYALIHLARLLQARRERNHANQNHTDQHGILHLGIALTMLVVAALLGAADGVPIILLKAISTILALAACFAGGGLLMARGSTIQPAFRHAKIKKGAKP
jgi:amino acid transporter